MNTIRLKTVTRPVDSFADEVAAMHLQISRMTLFRKLRDGTVSPPAPVPGSRRRWWRTADVEAAREQLGIPRAGRAS